MPKAQSHVLSQTRPQNVPLTLHLPSHMTHLLLLKLNGSALLSLLLRPKACPASTLSFLSWGLSIAHSPIAYPHLIVHAACTSSKHPTLLFLSSSLLNQKPDTPVLLHLLCVTAIIEASSLSLSSFIHHINPTIRHLSSSSPSSIWRLWIGLTQVWLQQSSVEVSFLT